MKRCRRRGRVRDEIAIGTRLQMIGDAVLRVMRVLRTLAIGCADGSEQRLDARMFERLRCDGRKREQQDRAYRREAADLPDDAPTQVMHAALDPLRCRYEDDDERTIMPCVFPCSALADESLRRSVPCSILLYSAIEANKALRQSKR